MLKVGIVGLGYWGPNLARNFATNPRTELSALCDADPDRVDAVGAQYPTPAPYTSYELMLRDPDLDVVAVATPVASHYELARAALLADKHVLLEKPFTATSQEGQDLIELADARGLQLLADHVFLYSPAVHKLGELVHSGELGQLLFIDSVRINLGLFQHDVNVLWDLAPHDLSIIDYLIGRAPKNVVAVGAAHAGNGLQNVAYLHLDYGDELLVSLHVNWLSPVKLRHFMIGGSRKSVLYNDLDPSERVKVYDRGIDVDVGEDPEGRRQVLVSYRSGDVLSPRIEHAEPLGNLVDHFADCVEHGVAPVSSAQQGLRVVRTLEAAEQSLAKGGTLVEVDQ